MRYLRKGREPVVYVHSSRWDVWAATWWLARVRGKSVVIALHSETPHNGLSAGQAGIITDVIAEWAARVSLDEWLSRPLLTERQWR